MSNIIKMIISIALVIKVAEATQYKDPSHQMRWFIENAKAEAGLPSDVTRWHIYSYVGWIAYAEKNQ